MGKYCESMKPINEVGDCGEGVDMRLLHNRDGSWALDVTGYYDGGYICGGATVPILPDVLEGVFGADRQVVER